MGFGKTEHRKPLMIYLTRRERFSAAHRMFNSELSDDENLELYGLCSNPEWHGHNYVLYVTVKGEMNPELGYVMNLKRLKDIIKDNIISKLDHRNLNTQVDFLSDKMISTESIALAIWKELNDIINAEGARLHCIKIEETENNYIEYFGE